MHHGILKLISNSIIAQKKNGLAINVYIQPGANQNHFCGVYGERLKIRLRAKAIDGAANTALLDFLAEFFRITRSSASLVKGHKSRLKVVFIQGDPVNLLRQLSEVLDI